MDKIRFPINAQNKEPVKKLLFFFLVNEPVDLEYHREVNEL